MDRSVRRMLKLIEEDGDSFAKKAEMYYQKRPELVSLVEEFYRMYRSLAERYDHVTGELRKNIPSDLQSQNSGISDVSSEPPSTWPSPAPEPRRRSGHRAAGFDFFLGSGGSSSDLQRDGDESSTLTDSEPESDDSSSVNNYSVLLGNGSDNALSRKVIELEIELREMKDRLQMQQEENGDGSLKGVRNDHFEDLLGRISGYEQELKIANQRIHHYEEEVSRLNIDLQRHKSLESTRDFQHEFASLPEEYIQSAESEMESEKTRASKVQKDTDGLEAETQEFDSKTKAVAEELVIMKEKLQYAEKEIENLKTKLEDNGPSEKVNKLQDQLALAHKDINTWKSKLNAEKREVSKLQERIARLKSSLSDRDHENRELKTEVSDAEQKIFPEKAQIKAEISKLLEEQTSLKEQVRERESCCRTLEDEIRKLQTEMSETEERHDFEINNLKKETSERDYYIQNLNKNLDALKLERDELNAQVTALKADVASRNDQIDEMDKHLQQLHMEHVKLIADAEMARKLADKVNSKVDDLEKEVERQKMVIAEGAEEKREAIRQLCFSLEHYRNGYHSLRQAFIGHKRVPVLAS